MEGDAVVRPEEAPNQSGDPTASLSVKSGSQTNVVDDDGDNCRICRGEGTTEQPLFYPCKCSGSIRFVHQECLMEWLAHSQKKYCELCKTPFTFTKLYDNTMPSTLPLALFIQQVTIHTVETILRSTRYVVVMLVWLCWLPWSIRQVWRGLFWVADGSWVSKTRLQEAALSQLAAVDGNKLNTTIASLGNSLHLHTPEAVSTQMQVQTSLFSGFAGFFTGDFLLVELAKFIFPSIGRWSQDLVSSDAADDPVILLTMDRQPSLLSQIPFIASLTKYRLINGALVDVLEGQLICLFIVIAFILVFLIREWVINQQPIANMPDPDNPVEAAGAGNVQDDAARAARRRRRALRNRNDEHRHAHDGPVPRPQLAGAHLIAEPRRQRRQIPNPANVRPEGETNVDDLPPRRTPANGLGTAVQIRTSSPEDSADSSSWVDEDEPVEARPPLPARGAFDNIAYIQRSIEEGSVDGVHVIDNTNPVDGVNEPINTAAMVDELITAEGGSQTVPQTVMLTKLDTTMERGMSQAFTLEDQIHSYTGAAQDQFHEPELLEASSIQVEASDISSESEIMDEPSFLHIEDSDIGETLEVESVHSIISTESTPLDTPETLTEDSHPDSGHHEEAAIIVHRSLLDKVSDWFWHLDENQGPAAVPAELLVDEEHIVRDAAAEAPFVPVHNREADNLDVLPIGEPPAPPPVQEPNMLFGVDLNNPDAMEDAEDLDGILELIGMQGPLAGMVQNVIFSEFLITLTIAASVWLPYIWGKIALLIIANPVGVFVKAPLFLASRFADFALDLVIFVVGLLTLSIASSIKFVAGIAGERFDAWHVPDLVNTMSSDMTKSSGVRLEDTLSQALGCLKPDLPTFSLRSHYALRVIQNRLGNSWLNCDDLLASCIHYTRQIKDAFSESVLGRQGTLQDFISVIADVPRHMAAFVLFISSYVRESLTRLNNSSSPGPQAIDISLARWNAKDKILAIVLGYLFFACMGYLYLLIARLVLGLRSEDKVEGIVADSLRQAGGVVKVMVIIGIEMIVFPLYCGLLLDAALMPLFEGVTLNTRIAFMLRAPITGFFVHWFVGTCYMFHFALFVSMCRKIFRKGVLYFIRDPDDPMFHPVRDVLERPVITQLGKIAFSGFIYGGLVYLCLGGAVYLLSCVRGILPIHWSTNEPQLAFPVDIIFYNFLLPLILRKTRPSKNVAAMYEWWFRGCAHALRLTNFLFGEDRSDEKGRHINQTLWSQLFIKDAFFSSAAKSGADLARADSSDATDFVQDGGYVRAPASDSVRIPKGNKVFLEVNEKNERLDGEEDKEKGMHGAKDDRFILVYTPPNFRARITTFILLLWFFAAATGVAFTIGPLLIGRTMIRPFSSNDGPPNDLYALTVGVHICAAAAYAVAYVGKARKWLKEYSTSIRTRFSSYIFPTIQYLLGILYLGAATCIFPVLFSLSAELYIHIPMYEYLSSDRFDSELPESSASYFITLPPTIFLLQTWTIGLVLVRIILRDGLGNPETSRPAKAIQAIVRRGILEPDVRLATRALLVPATLLTGGLFLAPLAFGRLLNAVLNVEEAHQRAVVYRYSYPTLAGMTVSCYLILVMKRRIAIWRTKIRDEVYLIGERLHNYQEARESSAIGKGNTKVRSERVEVG